MVSNRRASAIVTEFTGTFILTLVVLTVSKSSLNLAFFVSLSGGLAVATVTLLFGRGSGVLLNPALTLGLLSIKRIALVRALAYIAAQLAGGLFAYYVFAYLAGQRWHNGGQFETKLLVAEALGTFLFSLAWAATASQKSESARSATSTGLSFALALLAMSSAGAVMLNPAVALGLRSWLWGSSVLGPLVGAVAGFQAYKYVFAPQVAAVAESKSVKAGVQTVGAQHHVPTRVR